MLPRFYSFGPTSLKPFSKIQVRISHMAMLEGFGAKDRDFFTPFYWTCKHNSQTKDKIQWTADLDIKEYSNAMKDLVLYERE